MSAAPETQGTGGPNPVSKPARMLESCWSCRLLSGGGLILSGAYVFNAARNVMRKGGHTSMGVVAQVTFGASLAAWGLVILTDPVGKSHRVDEAPPSAGR